MTEKRTFNQPLSGYVVPRYGGMPTFMRLPYRETAEGLDIALIGVPWDGGTTNRAGARHGPREIRNMSTFMRKFHEETHVSPYDQAQCADIGDSSVNPIDLMDTLKRVEDCVAEVHAAGARPLTAGGDHLISLPILRAIARDQGPLGMVHFDAHTDTNDRYFGESKYTHGTPFRRAVEEGLLDPARIVQIGIRGSIYDPKDFDWGEQQGIRVIKIGEYFEMGVDAVIAEARRVAGSGPVYVSFDVDGLDPVYAPGTGTPEIGGFSTFDALKMIRGLRGLDVVGGDVVEVAPPFDPSGNTALVGATMMFEILCIMAEAVASR